MTPEKLDEARVEEARRRWNSNDPTIPDIATGAARLARENWTPPAPVADPDVLAYREWTVGSAQNQAWREEVLAGKWDRSVTALGFVAGARMAREQERERAKVLLEYVQADARRLDGVGGRAREALAKYEESGR